MKNLGILIFTLQLFSINALAWGTLGHRTSAQIAYNILKDQKSPALVQIAQILKADDFVSAATWADEARASKTEDWSDTNWYHFEKMNDNDQYVPHLHQQSSEDRAHGGIIQALLASETMLLDRQSTEIDKSHALKFIIHFIGDIHQPLHSGRVEDNGGNKVIVKWLGKSVNLHQIWDSQMIDLGHQDLFAGVARAALTSKYAMYLQNKFKTSALADQNNFKFDDWIHESMVPRNDAYTYKGEDAEKYTARFLNVVDQRIYLAGLRIAFTMNRIFPGYTGAGMATAVGQSKIDTFRQSVVAIVGDFTQIINLRPSPLKP